MKLLEKLENITNSLKSQTKLEKDSSEHSRYTIKNKNYKRVLIHNAPFLFTVDKNDHIQVLQDHSIVIENNIIKKVTPAKKIKQEGFDVIYDAGKRGGTVITPGLINAHAHSHQYLMRSSMKHDEAQTIDKAIVIWAAWQKHETDEAQTIAAIGDLTEQQKHGITTTLSHGPSFNAIEYASRATGHISVNAVSAISNSRPTNTPEMVEQHLKKTNTSSIPAVSVHYLYRATTEVLKKMRLFQEKYGALYTFHMAENEVVAKKTKKVHAMRETALLKKHGLLNNLSLASHVVHVTKKEIELLAAHGVGIVHLPTSNIIHKSGTFKFWEFEEANALPRLALGTDSVVSKSRLDILTEAYQTRISHLYERTVKFGSLFKMMTTNGARVLHMPERGKIIPGAQADICFWKLKDRGFIPYDEENPVTLLGNIITHGGRYVRDLMINGQFIIKDRKHLQIDESKLLQATQDAHMEMRKQIEK
jgi:5-methylthioadenosine/S-adenosylhomocysteine deaminase